jgi:hypothetical protein
MVTAGVNKQGHRSVSVKVKGDIPRGDTMVLAFSGDQHRGSVGAGGIITGPAPHCVSLPAVRSGGSGTSSSGTGTQAS